MKTLQEQYKLIQEGKGHKDMFLKSARRLFPEYVTNFATYNEAVTILKQKSIISEGIGGVMSKRAFEPFASFSSFLNEEAKAEEKKATKEVEDMETRGFDYKDKKNIDNVFGQQFLNGFYAEMKDPKNEKKTTEQIKDMVAKNLAKDINYYVKNSAFGVKGIGYTDEHPGLGPTKEVKGKYKSSGMEPVKIKEEMIKLTDLLKESIGGYVDIRPSGLGESYSEFQRDDKGSKDVDAKDKGEQDAYGAGVKKGEKIEKGKLMDRLKEIEAAGNVAALEAKMNAIDEEVNEREAKLSMVKENDAIAEFINPTRIKEIEREIKELSKAKDKYGKMLEKMNGGKRKEVVDEIDLDEMSDDMDM